LARGRWPRLELAAGRRGVSDVRCDAVGPSLEASYAKGTEQTGAFGNSMSALILAVHFGPLRPNFGLGNSMNALILAVHFGLLRPLHFGPDERLDSGCPLRPSPLRPTSAPTSAHFGPSTSAHFGLVHFGRPLRPTSAHVGPLRPLRPLILSTSALDSVHFGPT